MTRRQSILTLVAAALCPAPPPGFPDLNSQIQHYVRIDLIDPTRPLSKSYDRIVTVDVDLHPTDDPNAKLALGYRRVAHVNKKLDTRSATA